MFPATLLTTLLLALFVSANPVVVKRSPVTLPISRRVNLSSVHNLLRHDQQRAQALKAKGSAKSGLEDRAIVNEPVENQAVTYVASVQVGSPATTFDLLIDTGSSNTWVGAGTPFKATSTSTNTGQPVSVTYGSGSFSGTEFTDTLTIANGLTIPKQSIGVASTSTGFQGVDGILGIGPVDLTQGTLTKSVNTLIPTVTDNLFSSGVIPSNEIGISFEPTTTDPNTNGELTWGGTDSSKFTGSIIFNPLTTTSPASLFWGINQSVSYNGATILSTTAGIVDTGTTLVLLATNAFQKYQKATGGVIDNNTGLLRITSTQFANLKNLVFTTSTGSFTLTPNAQIWPRALNADIGGVAGSIYLIVNDLGSPSGEGLDFINGFAFLERFYAVFDTANKRVGFATTAFTTATTN